MSFVPSFHRQTFLAWVIGFSLAGSLPAQNLLRIEHEGKFKVVRKVVGMQAYVMENDKLVAVPESKCALQPVEEYKPTLVAVRDMSIRTTKVRYLSGAAELAQNNEFHFSVTLESPVALDDVFLVLDLDTTERGRVLFYHEVGRLEPGKPMLTLVDFTMGIEIGKGRYQLHLFAGGAEVFNSEQSVQSREDALDRMVAKRIAKVMDSTPKPFLCPPPKYPRHGSDKSVDGEAVLAFHLTARGTVVDPVVSSATDPAFGEAALLTIRQWHFLPEVRNGRAVETDATMRFKFTP